MTVGNETYYVRFTVEEERKSLGRLHSARVSTVEITNKKSREKAPEILGKDQVPEAKPAYDLNLTEFFDSVKGKVSKVIDKNGEPSG
ncbi:hypothetical protein AGMMS49546_34800 [Spirochaetia bacterium]|nr:hypothetical protein AGMMS49546_34800 [Spirochaetia bacterium]